MPPNYRVDYSDDFRFTLANFKGVSIFSGFRAHKQLVENSPLRRSAISIENFIFTQLTHLSGYDRAIIILTQRKNKKAYA